MTFLISYIKKIIWGSYINHKKIECEHLFSSGIRVPELTLERVYGNISFWSVDQYNFDYL